MTRITHILCPVDFSDCSRLALEHAAAVARWYGARLTVVHVVVSPASTERALLLADGERQRLLGELRQFVAVVPSGIPLALHVVTAPRVDQEIVAQTGARQADLLVIGSHGRSGYRHLLVGSVMENVIRKAACRTLVVPPGAPGADRNRPVVFRRILCPVDFSDSSVAALAQALDLARETDAHLTVLHAVEMAPAVTPSPQAFDVAGPRAAVEAGARASLQRLIPESALAYCTVTIEVVARPAYSVILRHVQGRQSDLIVMGVHGESAGNGLLFGSTAYQVVRAATCPVLLARHG